MRTVRFLAISALAVGLALAPARGQDMDTQTGERSGEPEPPISERVEGIIRDLVESMQPALEELRSTFEVFERVDSFEHYEKPEILPNGDIIIRRRDDAPPYVPEEKPEPEPGIRT